MKRLILLCAFTTAHVFAQCGTLAPNPITGLFDCTGPTGAGAGDMDAATYAPFSAGAPSNPCATGGSWHRNTVGNTMYYCPVGGGSWFGPIALLASLHTQNTDTGTTQTCFQLESGGSGPKLCEDGSNGFQVKTSADAVMATLTTAGVLTLGDGTAPWNLTGLTDDVAPGAPGTANQFTTYIDRTTGLLQYHLNGQANPYTPALGKWATFTGPTQARSYALPDAAASLAYVSGGAPSAGIATFAGSTFAVTSTTSPALGTATATSLVATGIVSGLAPVTYLQSADPCPTGTHCAVGATYNQGYIINGATTEANATFFDLPAAVAGMQYCFENGYGDNAVTTGVMKVIAASGDYITLLGVKSGTSGTTATSTGAAGEAACFIAIKADEWIMKVSHGTWSIN